MRMKCSSCNGEYETTLPDGTRYFHACAPEGLVRVKRAGTWQTVPIAAVQPTDTVEVLRGKVKTEVLISAVLDTDTRIGDTAQPRAQLRDENIDLVKAAAWKPGDPEDTKAKALGKGATKV